MVIMAGMFYSLTEAAEKLGKTEDEVKQLVTDGKLREFRDGSNLLFKIEEVSALLAEAVDVDVEMDLALEPEAVEPVAEVDEAMELEPVAEGPAEEEPTLELDEETAAPVGDEAMELEPLAEGPGEEEAMLELEEGTAGEEVTPDLELAAEAESTSELGLTADLEGAGDTSAALSDEDILADIGEAAPAAAGPTDEESEISLAPETGMLGGESDITDMDTALTGEGINVLGETDGDYDVTDDSLAETVGPAGTSPEASLEEIEEDVNLDSFGSGSGLLDLSLQADDTSLGGILDEIYTADGGEEAGEPSEADMVEDMTTEADQMTVAEEEMGAPEPMVALPTMTTAIVETAPDTQSNLLGGLLFLPLLALLYTAIVTVSALRGFTPSILESIQGMVWYIVGGGIVVSVLVVAASFVAGGGGGGTRTKAPKKARAKKEKKPKEKKAKKEKAPKAKKEKPAKAPKAKKEKKSLFGKRK